MEPVIAAAVGTAFERCLSLAEHHFSRGQAVKSANMSACVEFLRAAQSAITGLEDEVDEILIAAKLVARFQWDRRDAVYERIERYLNRDRLSTLLGNAIEGITSCLKFAERDTEGFFSRPMREQVTKEVLRLLGELTVYLSELRGAMSYSPENYTGVSGINVPELLQIQETLSPREDPAEEQRRRKELAELVEQVQRSRVRHGLFLVTKASRTIQELIVVFALDAEGRAAAT